VATEEPFSKNSGVSASLLARRAKASMVEAVEAIKRDGLLQPGQIAHIAKSFAPF
jgi:hypothetical protein